jgi:hypothetical protein
VKALLTISAVIAHIVAALLIGAGVVAAIMPYHPVFIELKQRVCGVQ